MREDQEVLWERKYRICVPDLRSQNLQLGAGELNLFLQTDLAPRDRVGVLPILLHLQATQSFEQQVAHAHVELGRYLVKFREEEVLDVVHQELPNK